MDHGREKMTEHVRGALDVHVDDGIKFMHGDVPERRVARNNRRVVDQQIGRAEVREDIAGPDTDRLVVGDIHSGEMVERSVFGQEFVDNLLRTRTTGHPMASRKVVFGEGAAATARDAGDDDVAATFFHDSEGGSRRPGAMFDLENRDGTEAKRR